MGYAIAAEAAARGHEVLLLTGPVLIEPPKGVKVMPFESGEELYEKVRAALPAADCLVMSAAVGDYRPAHKISGKHKKGTPLNLELIPARDVLSSLAASKGNKIFAGFAVEVKDAVENARQKVEAKGLDFLVLNSPASFGADEADFTLVFPGGRTRPLGFVAKTAVAAEILNLVERLFTGEEVS
jgi:phosphopantothenoylcysteine decarboxylase/phosphopantothenate--cysteine ligase